MRRVEQDVERQVQNLSAAVGPIRKWAGELEDGLAPQLESATWVGRRRWDLQFQTGETIALPEGEAAARTALCACVRSATGYGVSAVARTSASTS